MSREPTGIVFPDSPDNARVVTSADQISKPADSGPRAVVFNDPAVSVTPAARAARPHADTGPRPVVFPDTPNKAKPTPQSAATPRPVVPRVTLASAETSGPKALSFPVTPAAPPARAPGEVTFSTKVHPVQADIVAKARRLSPDVAQAQISRLERMVASLLPLRPEALQDYADKQLRHCREQTLVAARVSKRHVMLGAADLLARALASAAPASGLRQRLAQKFQQVAAGETPESWVVRLTSLRRELVEVLKEVRAAMPEARADAEKMALALLALRSTSEVCGTPPDRALAFALDQRLETLRVALSQATLVPAQLEATETTAALQLVEVDRLINVTFSAVALANGMRSPT